MLCSGVLVFDIWLIFLKLLTHAAFILNGFKISNTLEGSPSVQGHSDTQ